MGMDDLVAFLRARLDEDADGLAIADDQEYGFCEADGLHLWPPRALREVEAKRAILGAYESQRAAQFHDDAVVNELADVVQTLASIYSDHPDWRPAWAVQPAQ